MVPSGTITLGAGASQTFPGTNSRQNRVQIVITNLENVGGQNLKIQSANAVNGATVFPQTAETFETSADIVIFNPGSNSMDFEVMEFYPDAGFANAVPQFQTPVNPSGTPGVGGAGAPAGGGSSGGGYIGTGGRTGQTR